MKAGQVAAGLGITCAVAAMAALLLMPSDDPEDNLPRPKKAWSKTKRKTRGPQETIVVPEQDPKLKAPKNTSKAGQNDASKINKAPQESSKPAVDLASGVLEIEIVSYEGEPLEGCVVEARTAEGALPKARSNAKGLVRLSGLAEDAEVMADVAHPRYADVRVLGPMKPQSRVRMRWPQGQHGTLAGQITSDQGTPLSAAEIHVVSAQSQDFRFSSASLKTDSTGRYSLKLAPGRYGVYAVAKGFGESERQFVTIGVGQSAQALFQLAATGRIHGRVEAPYQGNDKFVIEIIRETGDRRNPLTQAKRIVQDVVGEGDFEVTDLGPGRYRVRLSLERIPNQASPWESFVLDSGAEKELNLSMAELSLSYDGYVVNAAGVGVAKATVECLTVRAETGKDGRFQLYGLPSGFQTLRAMKDGYSQTSQNVRVSDKHSQSIRLRIIQQGRVKGRVLDASGQPAPETRINLSLKRLDGQLEVKTMRTDSFGNYVFESLQPGQYFITAGRGDPFKSDGAPEIRVQGGVTLDAPDVRSGS